ncbi:MAG: NAD-dependent epimerase/dehydratase family protein [Solirubrobacteraceae bacterium]
MTPSLVARERFLITGAYGCIGAWVIRQLVSEAAHVVALDVSPDPHRLRLLMSAEQLAAVPVSPTDITDLEQLEAAIDEHEITNVIHLAALQVPFCRADPSLGARVNVVGTVNVLEAVARRRERMAPLVYASSIAAYEEIESNGDHNGRQPSADGGVPGTLYGVYKRANEAAAVVYRRDRGQASVGLRPHTVYGPGRDQGVTSSPTQAMLAAASGAPFHIPYGGRFQFQYAPDVANAFITASRSAADGASVHNLAGPSVHMTEVIAAIEAAVPEARGTISYDDTFLPFPDQVDSSSLSGLIGPASYTPVHHGVADTIAHFRRLIAEGLVANERDPMVSLAVRRRLNAASAAAGLRRPAVS